MFLPGSQEDGDPLGCADDVKLVLKKQAVRMQVGFIWLRIKPSGVL
jgi:hypothetical protein